MIVWQLDLQLPVQAVPISTKVVSSNPDHGEVCSIQHYVIKLSVTCDGSVVFSGHSPNKTGRHDITEIMLKVVLNTMTLTIIICSAMLGQIYYKKFKG